MRSVSALFLMICTIPVYTQAWSTVYANANYCGNCVLRDVKLNSNSTFVLRNVGRRMVSLMFERSTLYRIPQTIFNYRMLRNLTIPLANINQIDRSTFTNASNLQYLNLTANALEEIKNATFELAPALASLDLSYNRISVIDSDAFVKLEELEFLSISHNIIEEINEDTFRWLAKLEILYLDHNKVKVLDSDTFINNINLKTFYVEKNELSELAPTIFDNQKETLENLDLSDNRGIYIELKGFKKLDDVRLSHTAMEALEMVPSMTVLIADYCQISEVVGSDLGALMYAKLSHNNISNLSWIVNATKLYSLHLSFNRIETIGAVFNNLINLKYLYLDNVGLKSIGYADFSFQKNLQILDIGYNGLGEINFDKLVSLASLEVLYLDGNNLVEIPINEIIHIFPKLKTLGMSNNDWSCQRLALCVKVINKHAIALHVDVERNLKNKTTLAGMGCYEHGRDGEYNDDDWPNHSQENDEFGDSNDTNAKDNENTMLNLLMTLGSLYENDQLTIEVSKKGPNKAAFANTEGEDGVMSRLNAIRSSVNVSSTILLMAVLLCIGYGGFVAVQYYSKRREMGHAVQYSSTRNLIVQQGIDE